MDWVWNFPRPDLRRFVLADEFATHPKAQAYVGLYRRKRLVTGITSQDSDFAIKIYDRVVPSDSTGTNGPAEESSFARSLESGSRCAEAGSNTFSAKAGFAESYRSKSATRPIGTCFGSLPPKQSPSRKSLAKTRCERDAAASGVSVNDVKAVPDPASPTASLGNSSPTLSHTTGKPERNGTFMKNQGFQPPVDHPAS